MTELNLIELIFFWYLLRRSFRFIIFCAKSREKLFRFLLFFFLMLAFIRWRARFILRVTRRTLTIFKLFTNNAKPLTVPFLLRLSERHFFIFIKTISIIVVNRELTELRRFFILEFLMSAILLQVDNACVPVFTISLEILDFNLGQLLAFCFDRCHERVAITFTDLCLLNILRSPALRNWVSLVKCFSPYILLF